MRAHTAVTDTIGSRGARRTLLAVCMAVLVVTAAPGAAAAEAVASSHTTNAEFETGTLTGTATTGDTVRGGLIDDYEDGDLVSENDYWGGFTGDTANLTTASKLDGTAARLDTNGNYNVVTRTASTPQYPERIEFSAEIETMYSGAQQERIQYENSQPDFLYVQFNHDDNSMYLSADGSAGTREKIRSFSADTRYNIELDIDYASEEITVYVNGVTELVFNASGAGILQNGISLYKLQSDGDGSANSLYVDNHHFHNSPTENYYENTHAVENATSGFTDLSLTNSNATVTWEGSNGAGWSTVDQTTYTTSGNKTVDLSTSAYSEYRVRVAFGATGTSPDGVLSADGVTANVSAPVLDNSSASPTGGEKQSTQDPVLSINMTDADFPTVQGDTVTLEWQLKAPGESAFTTANTTTRTTNGTASAVVDASAGGTYEWRVVATDSYGESVTSNKYSFTTPATLFLRNETAPSELVNNSTSVTVTFYGDQTVVERTTTTGKVDLTGLPADETFVVQTDADGYHTRTVVIESLYEQQTVYLLSKSVDTVLIDFLIEDDTKTFVNNNTQLRVEKAIQVNNQTEFRTIAGDVISATGSASVFLQRDERYRLVVKSGSQVRRLGSYTATTAKTETLTIGQVVLDGDVDTGYVFQARTLNDTGQDYVRVVYRDDENQTTSLDVELIRIGENGNESTVATRTVSNTIGTYSELIAVNNSSNNYRIEWIAERDGTTITGNATVGELDDITDGWPVADWVLEMLGMIMVVAVGGLLVIYDSSLAGIGMVVTAGFLTAVGVLAIPLWALAPAAIAALLFQVGGGGTGVAS